MASNESIGPVTAIQSGEQRIEYDCPTERLKQLNATLALVAPRVPVFGSSLYRDVEEQSLRCIAKTLTEIENMKAGE
jgi:hypothetical protein